MEIHVVSSYIQRFQRNFEKGLRCLYPMWVDFNDHMTTIASEKLSPNKQYWQKKQNTAPTMEAFSILLSRHIGN